MIVLKWIAIAWLLLLSLILLKIEDTNVRGLAKWTILALTMLPAVMLWNVRLG